MLIYLEMDADFIGKAALKRIRDEGPARKQIGLIIDGEPLARPNTSFRPIEHGGAIVGEVTSAVYSPRLKKNIALALVSKASAEIGGDFQVLTPMGNTVAIASEIPFYDPKKSIAIAS